MAMKECYECGNKVSKSAISCPECGAKQSFPYWLKHTKPVLYRLYVLSVIIILGCFSGFVGFLLLQIFNK